MRVVKDREGGNVRRVTLVDERGGEVVAVNRFLSHLVDAGYSPSTACAYGYDLRHLALFLAERSLPARSRAHYAAVGRDDLRSDSCLILASRASGELTLCVHVHAGSLGLPRMQVYPRPGCVPPGAMGLSLPACVGRKSRWGIPHWSRSA